MPKPKKQEWIPRYVCPVCEEPTPFTSKPLVWHPECKPRPNDPKRSDRICPGCGTKHVLKRTGAVGSPSAFDSIACKDIYTTYCKLNAPLKPGRKKCRKCGLQVRRFTKGYCQKEEICNNCFFETNPELAIRYPSLDWLSEKNENLFWKKKNAQKS